MESQLQLMKESLRVRMEKKVRVYVCMYVHVHVCVCVCAYRHGEMAALGSYDLLIKSKERSRVIPSLCYARRYGKKICKSNRVRFFITRTARCYTVDTVDTV